MLFSLGGCDESAGDSEEDDVLCPCNQPNSFDNMIGCDNKKCAVIWFHFSCVGLTEAPHGKWFCPQCTPD